MSARIVVVGSLNMDLVIRAAHIPKPGETILGSEFQIIPGGKGANQAVAAARLGSQVSMVGRVGEDSFGDELLHNLEMVGVDGKHIRQDPDAASGVALIVVDDQGENSIVVASGSNMQLTEEDVEAAEGVISGAEVLIMQLEVPLQIVRRAAQIAHDNQVLVILNPAPAMPLPGDLFGMVDLLIPNESETAILTGLPAESQIEMETAASFLLDLGIKTVVITLGNRGALMANKNEVKMFSAYNVQPVDTTAAGDAFVAGLAVALGMGKSLPDAICWGNAAGALATLRFGAQTSLPTHHEVSRLLAGESPVDIIRRE